jgi:hypothetical protein
MFFHFVLLLHIIPVAHEYINILGASVPSELHFYAMEL